jgi:group I intron endonuclease
LLPVVIYLVRCLLNGKGYVGQTIRPFAQRWKEHCRENKGLLDRAISKYGEKNFEFCILATAHSLDELNALEVLHIRLQNTIHPLGYNLSSGGQNHNQHPLTRSRLRQRQLLLGWKPSESMQEAQRLAITGVPKSPEHRAKIAAANMGKKMAAAAIAKRTATRKLKGKSNEQ